MFTHELESVRDYDFKCDMENKGLLKVTGSHVAYIVKVIIYQKRCKRKTLLL